MHRIHIIGRKNSGKTTLVVDLVRHFRALGYRVGTIKHTHHQHELDTPGKDSYRHRQAGAMAVGIVAPTMNAVFWPTPIAGPDPIQGHGDKAHGEMAYGNRPGQSSRPDVPAAAANPPRDYTQFDALMAGCDLVLVEGDQQARATKVEVWHQGLDERPLVESDPSIGLLVTNDPVPVSATHRRDDLSSLGRRLLNLAGIGPACPPDATGQACKGETSMKEKRELEDLIAKIASPDSPVGMDAVYVHALILDKLQQLDERLQRLEQAAASRRD